jgi:hypothetical protein
MSEEMGKARRSIDASPPRCSLRLDPLLVSSSEKAGSRQTQSGSAGRQMHLHATRSRSMTSNSRPMLEVLVADHAEGVLPHGTVVACRRYERLVHAGVQRRERERAGFEARVRLEDEADVAAKKDARPGEVAASMSSAGLRCDRDDQPPGQAR